MQTILRTRLAALTLVVICSVAAASCASGAHTGSPAVNSTRLDSAEFRQPEFRTLYDAISRLRPDWLSAKGGPTSLTDPARRLAVVGVFVEGQMRGYPLEKLTEFVGRDVSVVRRISSSESLATYGPDWAWGGIVITRAR